MSESLLTTAEAAALLGITAGTLSNCVKSLGLTAASRRGSVKLYNRKDIERAVRVRAAARLAPRKARGTKVETAERANEKLARELEVEEQRRAWNKGGRVRPLDARERAIVYAAFLAETLGPTSQWTKTKPPASYRAAYESFRADEQGDDDAQAYAEAVAA